MNASALKPDRAISQYGHRIWKIEDGLPNSVVRGVLQTDDGYLWMGTYDGLARYNGESFTRFDRTTLPGLESNTIYALTKAHDGSLWIGTPGSGAAVISHGRARVISTRDGLLDDTVNALLESADRTMWIGTAAGLCVERNNRIERISLKTFPTNVPINALAEAGGFVWAGTRGGGLVAMKNLETVRVYTTADGLLANSATAIFGDRDGTLWIGTTNGLNRMRNGILQHVSAIPVGEVTSILRDSDGSLWIGTYTSGLFRSTDGEQFTSYTIREGLSNNSVRTIFEDAEKSLWVGTNGGVDRFTQSRFITIGAPEGLQDPFTRTVHQDRAGNILIGTAHGLYRLDRNGNLSTFTTQQGLAADYIVSIADTPDGAVWVGTPSGLNRIDGDHVERFDAQSGLLNSFIRALFVDRSGTLWIGTDGGVNWFRNGRIEAPSLPGFENAEIECFAEDHDGSVWIGSEERGLGHWSNETFSLVATRKSVPNLTIFSLLAGHDGALWIGTDSGGLIRMKDRGFIRLTTTEGLIDDKAVQLLDDGSRLWIGSSRGISSIDHQQLDDFVQQRRHAVEPMTYGYADGLRSVQCNGSAYPAAMRARDGRLFFATVNGVATVWPDAAAPVNRRAPPVVIENVIANEPPTRSKSLAFGPGTEKLEFHYSALSFVTPEKVRFRYKLEGFDRNWVDPGSRRIAYYTNIPPGEYRFLVRACNDSGIWNEEGAAVSFELLAPPWKSPLAYLLYALVTAVSIYTVVRWRNRSLHERAATLEQTVKARTRQIETRAEELATLNQVTNTITSMRELDPMLNEVARAMVTLFKARNSGITLLNDARTELRVVADFSSSADEPDSTGLRIPLNEGNEASVHVIEKKEPVIIPHAQSDPRMASVHGLMRERHTECLMIVPLLARGEVIGTIGVDSNDPDHQFSEDDMRLAQTLAGQIAGAIDTARLLEQERRSRELTEQLDAAAQTLNESLDLDAVLSCIMDQLHEVIDYTSGAIHLREGSEMRVILVRGMAEEEVGKTHPLTGYWFINVKGQRLGLDIDNASDLERIAGDPEAIVVDVDPELFRWQTPRVLTEVRSNIGVPLIVFDRMIGALTIDSDQPNHFSERDAQTARAFARHAAIAIENARLYASAQKEIAERARAEEALQHAAQAANAATLAKSQFLANMSHEIRTPLNAILGFVQLMMRKQNRDPEDRESLGIIMRSGDHLLGLINDVLSMAKIEAGLVHLSEAAFDCHALFAILHETFAPRGSAKQIDMRFEIDSNFPHAVFGDEAKLRQILFNLLGNAFKFTQSGHVTLRAHWRNGLATLEISDSGCGMAVDEVKQLFKPFVQTPSGEAVREGTGLGLAICNSFIQLMRGSMQVESELGKGSTFSFTIPLPAADAVAAGKPRRKVTALAPGQPRFRLLIADDTAENRLLLERLFASFGFEVKSANNGDEALDAWHAWKPHLVWMDIRMPVVDGYEATRRIREAEKESGRRTPIVAITASAFEHDRDRILAAGCDDMVVKPFVEASIFEMLARHLGVEWLYEDVEATSPGTPVDIGERMSRVSRTWREQLAGAMNAGDVESAYTLADEIENTDAPLAAELRKMIKTYRFDEIQAAVEWRSNV